MTAARQDRAQALIDQAEKNAAAYLPAHSGNEAERARMLYQLGLLRGQIRTLVAELEVEGRMRVRHQRRADQAYDELADAGLIKREDAA